MLSVCIYHRDFSRRLYFPGSLQVKSLSWQAVGGADKALIEATGTRSGFGELDDLLGCPLEVYDDHAAAVWWGYVDEIRLRQGSLNLSLGLEWMANRVVVEYGRPGESGEGGEAWPATVWLEDAESIETYGVKEERMRLTGASLQQAEALRSQVLESRRLPSIEVGGVGVSLSQNAPSMVEPGSAVLQCRGWLHRLGWRYYEYRGGRAASLCGGRQDWIGAQTADSAYAQSILVQGESAWSAATLRLRLKKIGSPADLLVVQLCADNNGQPGAVLAAGSLPGSQVSNDMRLEEISMDPMPVLQPGQRCWIVTSRSGGIDGYNYYMVDTDQGGGSAYPYGSLFVWNGTAWGEHIPGADLWFELLAGEESSLQLQRIINTTAIFTGVEMEVSSPFVSDPFRPGSLTCLQEARRLLDAGGADGRRWLAAVEVDRRIRIYPQESASEPGLALNTSGRLFDAFGRPLPAYPGPAGHWARLVDLVAPAANLSLVRAPGAVWIERIEIQQAGRGDLVKVILKP